MRKGDMRKKRDTQIRKIEEAFIESHRHSDGKAEELGGPVWTQRVMARVRREEGARERVSIGGGFEIPKVVWRFAAATSLAAMLMAAYVIRFDSTTRTEMAELSFMDAGSDVGSNFLEIL